jgi:hypothetical protein
VRLCLIGDLRERVACKLTNSPVLVVACSGRGRKVTNHVGNERFRDLIYSEINEYSAAENKTAKSAIIFRVLQEIKDGSPETGGFVKQDSKTKRWYAVEETTGRTTTAQAFRDALSSTYKSSKQFKQQRRWDRRTLTPSTAASAAPTAKDTVAKPEMRVATLSGDVAILPKIPFAFSACATPFPALPMRPTAPATTTASIFSAPVRPSTRLGDILNSALETVGDLTAGMEDFGFSQSEAKDFDLDQIVDLLGVQSDACNPFEPTPISPALENTHEIPGFPSRSPPFEQPKEMLIADNHHDDHCGHCWENKLQGQMLDNSFWQESTADPVRSGFSLRQALSSSSSCRQFPL